MQNALLLLALAFGAIIVTGLVGVAAHDWLESRLRGRRLLQGLARAVGEGSARRRLPHAGAAARRFPPQASWTPKWESFVYLDKPVGPAASGKNG